MTKLSPAAQAVLNATDYPEDWATRVRVAAALRAAAAGWSDDGLTTEEYDTGWRAAMDFIDAVADELEAQ
jgi:hypothetical protein